MNIFEPSWTLQIGERQFSGSGVLGNRRAELGEDFDLFSVTINGTQIVVLPKEGKIIQNLRTIFEGDRGKLIWFRTMMMLIGEKQKSTHCVCYGIGIESDGKRIGFKLYEDGRLEEGL